MNGPTKEQMKLLTGRRWTRNGVAKKIKHLREGGKQKRRRDRAA